MQLFLNLDTVKSFEVFASEETKPEESKPETIEQAVTAPVLDGKVLTLELKGGQTIVVDLPFLVKIARSIQLSQYIIEENK